MKKPSEKTAEDWIGNRMKALGERLRYRRKKAGVMASSAALAIGMKPQSFRNIENGQLRTLRSMEKLLILAELYGCDAWSMFCDNLALDQLTIDVPLIFSSRLEVADALGKAKMLRPVGWSQNVDALSKTVPQGIVEKIIHLQEVEGRFVADCKEGDS